MSFMEALQCIAYAIGLVLFSIGVACCGSGTPTPVEQAEVAAYGSTQVICSQTSATTAAADACRNAVKAFWCGDGGALREAGACAYSAPKIDGGGQ